MSNTSSDASADAVVIRGLTKRYGSEDVYAVDGLDLTVPRGSVFGLVGGNGSGKTTTLRTLLGLVLQDGGEARVFGEDSRRLSKAVRKRIGYLSENEFPYDDVAIVDGGTIVFAIVSAASSNSTPAPVAGGAAARDDSSSPPLDRRAARGAPRWCAPPAPDE